MQHPGTNEPHMPFLTLIYNNDDDDGGGNHNALEYVEEKYENGRNYLVTVCRSFFNKTQEKIMICRIIKLRRQIKKI